MDNNDFINIWKNKYQILEGLKNKLFKKEHVEAVAKERTDICLKCPYYDPLGKSKKATIKGTPSCSICGCTIELKTRCLSCECPVKKWLKVTGEKLEDKIKEQINDNI